MIGGRIQRLNRSIITRGLRARYFAGPESGNDVSGNGLDGTEVGSVVWNDGSFNRAPSFDASGNTAFGNIGSVDDLAFIHQTGVFSCSFRYQCNSNARSMLFLNSGTSTASGFMLIKEFGYATSYGTNCIRCVVFRSVSKTYVLSGVTDNNTLLAGDDDRWCCVFNKQASDTGQWYRNGVPINTALKMANGESIGGVATGSANNALTIGRLEDTTSLPANGVVEDLRIYDVNLTPEEAIAITTGRA